MRVTEITVPGEKGDVKWNAYTPDGAWGSRTTKALEKRGFRSSLTHPADGTIVTATLTSSNFTTGTIDICAPKIYEPNMSDLKPFKCPCCGGNSYRTVNGKTVCEYCDTEFVRQA